jgi:hypothetical protein
MPTVNGVRRMISPNSAAFKRGRCKRALWTRAPMATPQGTNQRRRLSRAGGVRRLQVEIFNCHLREESVNEHPFSSLRHVSHLVASWRRDYNHHLQHPSLEVLTRREFRYRSAKDQITNAIAF